MHIYVVLCILVYSIYITLVQIAEVKYPELAGFLPNLMKLMSLSLSLDSR